jgi:hypothetical protein
MTSAFESWQVLRHSNLYTKLSAVAMCEITVWVLSRCAACAAYAACAVICIEFALILVEERLNGALHNVYLTLPALRSAARTVDRGLQEGGREGTTAHRLQVRV